MYAIYLFGGAKIFLFIILINNVLGLTMKRVGKRMKQEG